MPYTLVLSGELTGDIFLQIDELLPQLGTVAPNGVYAAAHIGARYIDTVTKTEYKASLADGTIGGTTWDAVVNTIVDATETVKGVVEFATSLELAAGVDNTKAVTPFSMAGVFATVTDFQDEINDRISGDSALDVRLDAAEATLTNAVSAATPSVLMKRDAAGRAKVVDGAASTDIATKGQMDTADAAIQSQVTTLTTDVTTNATAAPTANRLVRRDANARFQAAAASASADVVIKSQLDSTDAVVSGITAALGTPTDAATPSTIVKRDAAGRFKAVAGSAGSDVIVKTQLDSTDAVVAGLTSALGTPTDAATVSTLMKRDAAGRAKVVDGAVASDIATKGQVDTVATALGTPTDAATVSQIIKRDSNGRAKVADGVAASDIATVGQLSAVGTPAIVNGFRLSLSSSDPNPTSVASASTIYAIPYKSDQISLYNGSSWSLLTASSMSIAVPSSQYFRLYSVWCYDNSTVPTLEVEAWAQSSTTITAATVANPCVITANAHGLNVGDRIGIRKGTGTGSGWTNTAQGLDLKEYYISAKTTNTITLEGSDTTGLTFSTYGTAALYSIATAFPTAPVAQNGVPSKTGTLTRRLLGVFKTDGAGVVHDTLSRRNVSNVDNLIKKSCFIRETNASYSSANNLRFVARNLSLEMGLTRFEFVLAQKRTISLSNFETAIAAQSAGAVGLNRVDPAVIGATSNLLLVASCGYASGYHSSIGATQAVEKDAGAYFAQRMIFEGNSTYHGDTGSTYAGANSYAQMEFDN